MKSILTTVTSPTYTDMTTLARVQEELELTASKAKKRVPNLIKDASALICDFCDRQFARTTVRQQFPVIVWPYPLTLMANPVLSRLRLLYVPVLSIVSATYNGTTVDTTQIQFNPDTGELYGIGYFDDITYVGGYDMPGDATQTNPLPREVERACIDTVSMLWFRGGKQGRDPMIKTDQVEKVGLTSYFNPSGGNQDSLPPSAVASLSRYQRVNI